jgi:hypothetical protein
VPFEIKATQESKDVATVFRGSMVAPERRQAADVHHGPAGKAQGRAMLPNGSYSAWFRTPLWEGTGTVILSDGRISGGDALSDYAGTYIQDGDRFKAQFSARQHTPGERSAFGIAAVDLSLIGKSKATTAYCTGSAKQAPYLSFEATLIRIEE